MQNITPAALVVASAVLLAACGRAPAPPEPVRFVRTTVVGFERGGGVLEYAADIRARTEARLGFRVSGKMVARPAEVGRQVRAGDVLARLDPEDLRLGQDAARAAVNAAQVNLDWAQAEYRRFKDLRDQGFISGAELDRREAALNSARAQWEQARAQAGVQSNQATYATLTAPSAGVVTAVEAEPGAVLSAGVPVVRVAFDGPRDVVFSVPEDAIDALRPRLGKEGALRVRLWATGAQMPATVREIGAAADPVTRTFQVKADLGAQPVRLGQTATVLIELPPPDGVARLPLTAVAERQGGHAVWVVDRSEMTVKSRPVTLAGADGNDLVVKGGVTPGELVVTAGVHVLTEGQKVQLLGAGGADAAARTAQAAPPGHAAPRR